MNYTPSPQILQAYANVLINFALNSGKGLKKGECVRVSVPECAKPLYAPLRNAILKAGGHPIMQFTPDFVQAADVYNLSSEEQLQFFPEKYMRGLIDQADHFVSIIAEADKYEMSEVDPKKMFMQQVAYKPAFDWRNIKEAEGKFTWTLGMYGTKAMADDVGMTEEEYWDQIIKACYLDDLDPIARWKATYAELGRIQSALNSLPVESLHVLGSDVDLTVKIGSNRSWLGGSGRNIPSFELFISPDWRGTEGWIHFNQPLYHHGTVIEGIELTFSEGLVTSVKATKNQHVLEEMVAVENANKIGEYSLTDSRFSEITKVMGETLFDENMGGPEGNTHLALGNAYMDSYSGNQAEVTKKQWEDWGYNTSAVHTDIISTTHRTVTATLSDGTKKVIYSNGQFTV